MNNDFQTYSDEFKIFLFEKGFKQKFVLKHILNILFLIDTYYSKIIRIGK